MHLLFAKSTSSHHKFSADYDMVGKIYAQIMQIECRLLPCRLYTASVPPPVGEVVVTLINNAQLNRPEDGIEGLSRVIAASVDNDIYRGN